MIWFLNFMPDWLNKCVLENNVFKTYNLNNKSLTSFPNVIEIKDIDKWTDRERNNVLAGFCFFLHSFNSRSHLLGEPISKNQMKMIERIATTMTIWLEIKCFGSEWTGSKHTFTQRAIKKSYLFPNEWSSIVHVRSHTHLGTHPRRRDDTHSHKETAQFYGFQSKQVCSVAISSS